MRKMICFALGLLLLLSAFAGCGSKKPQPAGTTAAEQDTDSNVSKVYDEYGREMIYSPLPSNTRFNNEEIVILAREGDTIKGQFEETALNPDILNHAVLQRNSWVEDQLNVSLTFQYTEAGNTNSAYHAKIVQSAMGSKDYDIASTFAYYSAAMLYQGYYANLLEEENLYLNQPYWNQSYIEEATIYDQLYMAIGDASLLAIQNTFCTFFNKNALKTWAPDLNLYEKVQNNEWTGEYFYQLVKSMYQDASQNNRIDEDDFFGLVTSSHSFNVDAFFSGAGLKICQKNESGIPELVLNSLRTQDVYEQTLDLLYNNRGVYCMPTSDYAKARDAFRTSHSVFSIDLMRIGAEYCREMERNIGVLPLYKYNEDQKNYATTVQDSYDTFAILANIGGERREICSAVLELMNYQSYLTVRPLYFEVITKVRYSDEQIDAQMYDLILDGVSFDYGMINSFAISTPNLGHLWRQLLEAENSNFSSVYQKNAKVYEDGLKEYLNYFAELAGVAEPESETA